MVLLSWTTILRRLIVPVAACLVWTPAAQGWSWPVQGPVVQPFSYDESHPYVAGQHRGIDVGADTTGETVVAPAAGAVSFAGTVPTNGKTVTIETADGYSVTLTHLGSITVAKGAPVTEGEAVGTVGPSGTAEVGAPYVHLGIRIAADPNGYVDPLSLLPPVAEAGPSDNSASGTQPVASGGSSSTAPAAQPSTPVAPATPAPAAQGTIVQATPARVAPHSRARTPGAGTRPKSWSQRPSVTHSATSAPRTKRRRPVPHRRVSEPVSASRRPVVEAAAHDELSGLDAGHELAPSESSGYTSASRQEPSSAVLTLACNGAAALVAVAAAFAAARRRRRGLELEGAGAHVIRLPHPSLEHRGRRAA